MAEFYCHIHVRLLTTDLSASLRIWKRCKCTVFIACSRS